MGMGIKGISGAFELSRNTVRKYVRMFQESGIPIPKLMEMSESRLQEMFVVSSAGRATGLMIRPVKYLRVE